MGTPGEASTPDDGPSSSLVASGVGDLITDRQFLIDSVAPPLLFVGVNALAGLRWAAGLSLGFALVVLAWRVWSGHRVLFAATGLGGAVVSVGVALASGRASAYFVPGIIGNAVFGLVCVASILARRPVIAYSSRLIYRWPWAWYLHDRVRPAYSEITWVWAAAYLAKAALQVWLVDRDATGLLAVVRIATGLPAFAVLLVATYAYVNWRLTSLDAPAVEAFSDDDRQVGG